MVDHSYDQQHTARLIGQQLRSGEGFLPQTTVDALRQARNNALLQHRQRSGAPYFWAHVLERRWVFAAARALVFLVFFAVIAQSGTLMHEAFSDGYEHDASILADDLPLNAYLENNGSEKN